MSDPTAENGAYEKWGSRALLVLSFSLPFILSSITKSKSFQPAEMVGEMLFYFLLAGGFAYAWTKGNTKLERARLYLTFSLLFLALSVYLNYQKWQEIQSVKHALNEIITVVDNAKQQMELSNSGQSARSQASAAIKDESTGNQTDIQILAKGTARLAEEFGRRMLDLNKRYLSSRIDKALSPANLTSQSGISESRAIVENVLELNAERLAMVLNYYKEIKSFIDSADVLQANKDSYLVGVEDFKPQTLKAYYEMDRVGNAYLQDANDIINLAENNLGKISINNGQLIFPNKESLGSYNFHLQNIITLAEEETAIRTKLAEDSAKQNEKLKKKVNSL
ncbi:hypothetical protein A7981_07370 [Methylovorus sp. MM2]|uniref:hypothetical protein n=1 Tax=Methylovorus sp. MM2 TaxID=1848038 RepID=UPI0007E1A6F8|nr:hypothetical protein [Methylovorus sp. MM2]OAM53208.1 hypothetical protein A7981_07370 [Methylovorus sp. MM2]